MIGYSSQPQFDTLCQIPVHQAAKHGRIMEKALQRPNRSCHCVMACMMMRSRHANVCTLLAGVAGEDAAETSLFVEPLRWMSGALQLGKDQVVSGKLSCPGCASLSQLFWVEKITVHTCSMFLLCVLRTSSAARGA